MNGTVVGYEKEPKDVVKHTPSDASIVRSDIFEDGRELEYDNGTIIRVDKTDKEYGTSPGDICIICKTAELKDAGGCATCANCGAQIQCGL